MATNEVLRFNVQTEMEKERANNRVAAYAQVYAAALKNQQTEKKD